MIRAAWRNVRSAMRRLFCDHPHWEEYHARRVRCFGRDYGDGHDRAIGVRGCLKCGMIRMSSATASTNGMPGL